jgi:heptaprenyl diphosphate synthase
MIEAKDKNNVYKIAALVALSCVLQISESLIPHPIPGLRLGLANVITLITLVTMGFGFALEVTILRTILGSFIMGTFMSPPFILSFSAGLISALIMGFLYWLSSFNRRLRLSIVGISILGAISHNIVQLYLAFFLLVKHPGIFIFFPWLLLGALVMGLATGIIAGRVCLKLKDRQTQVVMEGIDIQADQSGFSLNRYSPGNSIIHRLPGHIKIIGVFILSLAIIMSNNLLLYLCLFLFLSLLIIISNISFNFIFSGARKYASMVFASFLFPVVFNPGKHVLSRIAYFNITSEGINIGILFALRILFLISLSSLLCRTSSPKELARGLSRLLSPLKPLGISGERTSAIFSLSWDAIPVFWDMARKVLRQQDFKRIKNLGNLIPLLSDFIAGFYLETEQIGVCWKNELLIGKEVDDYSKGVING